MLSKQQSMSIYEMTPIEEFDMKLFSVLHCFRQPLQQLRKFRGRKPCREALRLQCQFYSSLKLNTGCCERLANVIAKHYFLGHGARTPEDRVILKKADTMLDLML